jgi:transcriptional repressor NrdR
MRCPQCGANEDRVVDSRDSRDGRAIRRRRECLKCQKRFTTYEMVEEISLMVVKKDGRREPFNRQKILTGIRRACQKRPISLEQMEAIVDEIEKILQASFEREVKTTEIGNLVMEKLKALDKVAYVRFASVYREFKDTTDFMKVL